ncbi:carboxylesterase [Oleiphilus sp. HI0072]|nr:carboxylesterase [Oleiphilus sp. HI0072]
MERQTADTVSASIIWLHGLGANGNDFVPIVEELALPEGLGIRFIFPNASEIPITVNAGYIMPAWYDILELTEERVINHEQLQSSVKNIQTLIDREIERGIKSERIIVMGFSQGGAVAYHAALTYPSPLAALAGLSTYFPQEDSFDTAPANSQLPVLICHGTHDPMVVERQGKKAAAILEARGHTVQYLNYPMEHEVCLSEIQDLSRFFQAHLM